MTFGLKLALWFDELQRDRERLERARHAVSVGKVSGAVGTYAHLEPGIEQLVCDQLNLRPAPVASQVIQRDRHAELLSALAITAASLETFALEIRGLQKTELGERGDEAAAHFMDPRAHRREFRFPFRSQSRVAENRGNYEGAVRGRI